MTKKTKLLLAGASTATIAAVAFAGVVMGYGKPNVSQAELDEAHNELNFAIEQYDMARAHVMQNMPETRALDYELDSLYNVLNTEQTSDPDKTQKRIEQLECERDDIVNKKIREDKNLNDWSSECMKLHDRVEQLQRDSAKCDSISKVGFRQQMRTIERDCRKAAIIRHQKRLQELQNVK